MKNLVFLFITLSFLSLQASETSSEQKYLETNKNYRKALFKQLEQTHFLVQKRQSVKEASDSLKAERQKRTSLKERPLKLLKELENLDSNINKTKKKIANAVEKRTRWTQKGKSSVEINEGETLIQALLRKEKSELVEVDKFQKQVNSHQASINAVRRRAAYRKLVRAQDAAESNYDYYYSKHSRLIDERDDIQRRVSDAESEVRQAESDIWSAENSLRYAESELSSARSELSSARSSGDRNRISRAESRVQTAEYQVSYYERQLDDARDEKRSAERELSNAKSDLSIKEADIHSAKSNLDHAEWEWDQAKSRLNSYSYKHISPLQRKKNRAAKQRNHHKSLARQMKKIAKSISEAEIEFKSQRAELKRLDKRRVEIPNEIRTAQAEYKSSAQKVKNAEAVELQKKQEHDSFAKALAQSRKSLSLLLKDLSKDRVTFLKKTSLIPSLAPKNKKSVLQWQLSKNMTDHDFLQGSQCVAWGENDHQARLEVIANQGTDGRFQEPLVILMIPTKEGTAESFVAEMRGSRRYSRERIFFDQAEGKQVFIGQLDQREKMIENIRRKSNIDFYLKGKGKTSQRLRFGLKGSSKAVRQQFADCGLKFEKY